MTVPEPGISDPAARPQPATPAPGSAAVPATPKAPSQPSAPAVGLPTGNGAGSATAADPSKSTVARRIATGGATGTGIRSSPALPAVDDDDLVIGSQIAGCRIDAKVGQGGMGAVYKACHLALEKLVAIKVLSKRLASDPTFLDRFLREARLAARLEHENIVQVYDTGTDKGRSYIAMQFVAGENLRTRLKRGLVPVPDGVRYLTQAARGLAAAHAKKVIHRDIKPENLLLTETDQVKVADFGLAEVTERLSEDPTASMQGGVVLASANFMAPEQADLIGVDARSDLYSLGVSFWMVFCGKRLFTGDTHLELVVKHQLDGATPATLARRDIPLVLAAVLHKLVQKRPEDRYQNATELLDDLALLKKRQLPKAPMFAAGSNLLPARVDFPTLQRGGVKRCLEIQRAMKARNDAVLPLGQLLKSNNVVQLAPPTDVRTPADLPFVWPADAPLPDLAGFPDGHPEEQSLSAVLAHPGDLGRGRPFRLTRAPVKLAWDSEILRLELLGGFSEGLSVDHYFDLLLAFPFPTAPQVELAVSQAVVLSVEDVPWLVETQNIIKRRGGKFRVIAIDPVALAFFTSHHLTDYIDVKIATGSSVADLPGSGAKDDTAELVPVRVTAKDREKARDGKSAERKISPIDEARALLALDNPLGAKQVLMPHLTPQPGKPEVAPALKEAARDVATMLVSMGKDKAKAEDHETAKEWFDHAIAVCPDFADAYFQKALALKKLGALDYAIRYVGEAMNLKPNDTELLYNRAILLARTGQWRESVEDLTRAIEADPKLANAYYNRGIAYEKLGEFGRAKADYLIALKLDSRFQKVLLPRLKALEARK